MGLPMDERAIFLPAPAAERIRSIDLARGDLQMHRSKADDAYVVSRLHIGEGAIVPVVPEPTFESLRWGMNEDLYAGQWFRAESAEALYVYLQSERRPTHALAFDSFRELFPHAGDPGGQSGFVLVHHSHDAIPGLPFHEFTAWRVTRDGVHPLRIAVEPTNIGPGQLETAQSVDPRRLALDTVTIVGVGSIGSATLAAVADLGIGTINLVDPDRLLWHNIVRHRLGPESVGRFKVNALKTLHDDRRRGYSSPHGEIVAHRLDVVAAPSAFYEIARTSDVVICCADGVAPRRVVNHLARIAGVPAVFACVLDDGAVGEIFRSRPGRKFGCLSCHRAWLAEQGAMDPEQSQELGYGTGDPHRPMTALPQDLVVVGAAAAQVSLATLLESKHGQGSSRLPGEHAVIGLRGDTHLAWPFGAAPVATTTWNDVPGPRENCATCSIS